MVNDFEDDFNAEAQGATIIEPEAFMSSKYLKREEFERVPMQSFKGN